MNCFKFNSVLFLFVCLIRHTRTHIYLVVTTANIFFCIGYPIIKRWMVGNFSINRFHPPHLSTFSSQLLWNRHIYPPSQTSYCETATFIHLLKPATVKPSHLSTFSSQLLWNRHIYLPSQASYCETVTCIHLLKPATVKPPHLSTFSNQLLWNRHIYPPSQTSYCISHAICLDPTCVQWVEVRDSCPFPWYWWMAVSSLFKLYLMNIASDWDVR